MNRRLTKGIRIYSFLLGCLAMLLIQSCQTVMPEGNENKLVEDLNDVQWLETQAVSDLSTQVVDDSAPEEVANFDESSLMNKPTPDRSQRLVETKIFERINPQELSIGTPVIGEVPEEIMVKIMDDLVQKTEGDSKNILVIRSEAVTWSDGSLGCPKPGEFYTQALVDGYWVVLQIEGVNYDYRASKAGYFTICEGGGSPPRIILPDQ